MKLKEWVALAVIGCMAFVATCGEHIVCLCSDDPDGCGEHCHVCGEVFPDGLSAADPCNHFSFSNVDFWTRDESVRATDAANALCTPYRMHRIEAAVSAKPPCLDRARSPTAPPDRCSDSALFRTRRVLLLS